ncbi:MAG: biopolymer transporter ExbD, partial [Gemmatimonadetes bacterium]|nr:biopolymer transporter ExbD [Gemmatimonadota bacterium]
RARGGCDGSRRMMKRRFTNDEDAVKVVAEINVTSLVDVAFTLLIIFMITAPILQGGIEIEVPEAAAGPLSSSEALIVSIDDDEQIYLDDVPVTYDEFDASIDQMLERQESADVFLKADTDLRFGIAVRVMGRIHEAGATAVNIIANTETRRRP